MKYLIIPLFITLSLAIIPADQVNSLPEWPQPLPFQMFSGLLSLGYTTEKQIHYVLLSKNGTTFSSNNTAPLILWLNGGPGCSSLIGMILENGPYVLEHRMTEFNGTFNIWSWNTIANILYLETPAGVGFSPTNLPYNSTYLNDNVTMLDNYEALQTFFKGYPELANAPFWVTGESYAGMYVPWLANYIDEMNSQGTHPKINLKGIMAGNAVLNFSNENLMNYGNFYYGHHMISKTQYKLFNSSCSANPNSATCQTVLTSIYANLYGINPYNVFSYCHPPYGTSGSCFTSNSETGIGFREFGKISNSSDYDVPCTYTKGIREYLNNQTVKEALHVNTSTKWDVCSEGVADNYQVDLTGSIPQIKNLLAKHYHVLIYSGDKDSCVPYLDSENWVNSLNLNITSSWKRWFSLEQVGGFWQQYNNLTFATVLGAGHFVPMDKRAQSLEMVQYFVEGLPFPSNPPTMEDILVVE